MNTNQYEINERSSVDTEILQKLSEFIDKKLISIRQLTPLYREILAETEDGSYYAVRIKETISGSIEIPYIRQVYPKEKL